MKVVERRSKTGDRELFCFRRVLFILSGGV